MKLNACKYECLPMNTRIFNISTLSQSTWIYVPLDNHYQWILYTMIELLPNKLSENDSTVGVPDYVEQVPCKPWVKIDTHGLNTEIGTHIYQLKYISANSTDETILYFSYVIQNNNPNKPYIYMQRTDE